MILQGMRSELYEEWRARIWQSLPNTSVRLILAPFFSGGRDQRKIEMVQDSSVVRCHMTLMILFRVIRWQTVNTLLHLALHSLHNSDLTSDLADPCEIINHHTYSCFGISVIVYGWEAYRQGFKEHFDYAVCACTEVCEEEQLYDI